MEMGFEKIYVVFNKFDILYGYLKYENSILINCIFN